MSAKSVTAALKPYALATAAAAVTACAYLQSVVTGSETLASVTTNEWLGLPVFVGAAFGLTQRARNTPAA